MPLAVIWIQLLDGLQRSEPIGFSIEAEEREPIVFQGQQNKGKKERQLCIREGKDRYLGLKSRERPDCRGWASLMVREWSQRLKNKERPACRGCAPIKVRDWLPRLKNREARLCTTHSERLAAET